MNGFIIYLRNLSFVLWFSSFSPFLISFVCLLALFLRCLYFVLFSSFSFLYFFVLCRCDVTLTFILGAAPLFNANSPIIVPGSYIIILNEGLSAIDRDAHIKTLEETITKTGAADAVVDFRYQIGSLVGFAAHLNKDLLAAELAHPDVKYVECDTEVSINYIQEPQSPLDVVTQTGATWGLDRIDQANLPLNSLYLYSQIAFGVDVYVIDTGIFITHQDFGGRATFDYSAVTGEANNDLNGHGTHCSGTIGGNTYGVAKSARLHAVKVLNSGGSGTVAGVVAGVNFVTQEKQANAALLAVASMSLGGGASQALDDSVTASIAAGVIYSIAAGNSATTACNSSPSRVATAVVVGATDNTDSRASYSNYGTCVHIFAPGSSVTSAWIGSNTATNTISGTSMATPHVAGVLALQLGFDETLKPADNKALLLSLATPSVVTNPGTGSPNLFLFSNPLGSPTK